MKTMVICLVFKGEARIKERISFLRESYVKHKCRVNKIQAYLAVFPNQIFQHLNKPEVTICSEIIYLCD